MAILESFLAKFTKVFSVNFGGVASLACHEFCSFVAILESFLVKFTKVFSVNFGGVASFGLSKASKPRKISLQKLYFSLIRESFLPQKFPTIWYVSQIHKT